MQSGKQAISAKYYLVVRAGDQVSGDLDFIPVSAIDSLCDHRQVAAPLLAAISPALLWIDPPLESAQLSCTVELLRTIVTY